MFSTIICVDTLEIVHSYSKYLTTEHWKMFRPDILIILEIIVNIVILKRYELHHLNYDTLGREEFDDVIFLCRLCHEKNIFIFNVNEIKNNKLCNKDEPTDANG